MIAVVLLCMTIVPLTPILAPAAAATSHASARAERTPPLDVPTWSENDWWRYHRVMDTSQEQYTLHTVEDITYTVEEIIDVEHAGANERVYNITFHSTLNGTAEFTLTRSPSQTRSRVGGEIGGGSYAEGFLWRRVSDLALIRDYRYIYAELISGGVNLGSATASTDIVYTPAEEAFDFPVILYDQQWRTDCAITVSGVTAVDSPLYEQPETPYHESGALVNNYTCPTTPTMEVPYGSLETYHVDGEGAPGSSAYDPDPAKNFKVGYWLSPAAETYAKYEFWNLDLPGQFDIDHYREELIDYGIDNANTLDATLHIPTTEDLPVPVTVPNGSVRISGTGTSGETVEVSVAGRTSTTTVDAGRFSVTIAVSAHDDTTPTAFDIGSHGIILESGDDRVVITVSLRRCDLVITNLPGIIQVNSQGSTVNITASVYNRVRTYLGDPFTVSFYRDYFTEHVFLGNDTIHGILEYADATLEATVPSGEHNYTIVVDSGDGIAELDEENNIATSDEAYTNFAPQAVLTASESEVRTFEPVIFDASLSTDVDNLIQTYVWDLDASDGTDDEDAWGKRIAHEYTDGPASYTVTVTVIDVEGASATASIDIEVANRAPKVAYRVLDQNEFVIEERPIYIEPNSTVTFDAGATTDRDGEIGSYHWDLGDGTTHNEPVWRRTFEYENLHEVTLTVTDDDGATDNVSFYLNVYNCPPRVVITASTTALQTNSTLTVDASGSFDPDGAIVNYTWAFGDNTTAYGPTATHRYRRSGSYRLTLTLRDAEGKTNASTMTVEIGNRPPNAAVDIEPDMEIYVGQTVNLSAARSTDADGAIGNYVWDLGDGNRLDGSDASTAQNRYLQPGIYNITLNITDDAGATNQTTITVTVHPNTPPTAGSIQYTTQNLTVQFEAVGCEDASGTIDAYRFGFGDGSDSGLTDAPTVSHTYGAPGTYTVNLTVRDSLGAESTTIEQSVTVELSDQTDHNHTSDSDSDAGDIEGEDDSSMRQLALIGALAAIVGVVLLVVIILRRR